MNAVASLGLGFALALPCLAGAATFHAPSPSTFPDTESVTNVAFSAGGTRDFLFTLSLQLDASASNNVEVAFGRDLDGNGELDRSEADLLVGWDSGDWFWRDRRSNAESRTPRDGGPRTLDWQLFLDSSRRAKTLNASDGDGVVFSPSVSPPLFDPGWDVMRIATRGLSSPDGVVVCKVTSHGFLIVIQ